MAKKRLFIMLAAIMFLSGCSTLQASAFPNTNQAQAPASTAREGAYMLLVVPDLTFMEWRQERLMSYPHLYRLFAQGHNGAMNIRLTDKGIGDLYASMGAGERAAGLQEKALMNGGPQSSGWQHYYQRNGAISERVAKAAIVVPGISSLRQSNETRYGSYPGTLGEQLHNAGIPRSVLAAPLTLEESDEGVQAAPLLLMDAEGSVDSGRLEQALLIADPKEPGGVRSNYDRMEQQLFGMDRPGVMMVEINDFSRLQSMRTDLRAAWYEQQEAIYLQRLNDFIGHVMANMQEGDTLLLFSSHIHDEARKQRLLLAPIVRYEVGSTHAWLTSQSTNRSGIVSWVDLAPTVVTAFGLNSPVTWPGAAITATSSEPAGQLTWLQQENDRMAGVYALRPRVLYPLAIFQMTILVIALFYLLYRQVAYPRWLQSAMYAVLGIPAVLLSAGWFSKLQVPVGPGAYGPSDGELLWAGGWPIYMLLLLLLAGCLWLTRFSALTAMLAICSTIVALQVIDLFTGGSAIRFSLLGFDAMIGARYYGIGNEMMGVLLGSALLAASLTMQLLPPKRQRVAHFMIAGVLLALLVVLAAPDLGANAGGAIAAAIGFGYYVLIPITGKHSRRRIWLTIGLSGMFLIAALSLLYLLNVTAGTQPTHIAKGFAHLLEGRWQVIGQIILRKLAMNWHLLQVSIWSKVLLAGVAVLVIVTLSPDSRFNRQWRKTRTQMLHGFSAISLAVLAALLFNDSGIVAAATMIVYAAVPMLLLPALPPDEHHFTQT